MPVIASAFTALTCTLGAASEEEPPLLQARAAFAVSAPGSRQEYLRVSLRAVGGALEAVPFGNQSSGVLSSVSHSNALAVIPPGATVSEGDMVQVMLLDLLA